jgi:hypothetical protein
VEVEIDMVLAAEPAADSGELTPVREPDLYELDADDSGLFLEVESGMLLAQDSDLAEQDGAGESPHDASPDLDAAGAQEREEETRERLAMPEPETIDLAHAIDLAELYEMATVMEETGLLPQPTAPPWLGPLTSLRGVRITRQSDGPGFESALAAVRGAATLADAVEALLAFLVGRWSAAMLLCRVGDALVPWSAAGDVEGWDELCEFEVPLADGWLSARSQSPGVTLAPLDDDLITRRLSDLLTAQSADQGLALSFALDQSVLVVFASRWGRNALGDGLADYQELQRELVDLTGRIDRFSRLPTMRKQSARAGSL